MISNSAQLSSRGQTVIMNSTTYSSIINDLEVFILKGRGEYDKNIKKVDKVDCQVEEL